jgi:integrase/recombinase XerD
MAKAYLEPAEIERLENAATNLRDRLLTRLLFHLGCRVSEALSITVEDIDLGQGAITIQHFKLRLNLSCPHCHTRLGRNHSFCPSCGQSVRDAVRKEVEHRRVRTLPVDVGTVALLKEFIYRGGPVVKADKTLLFSVNRHRAWQIVKECAERAGLPKLINPETGRLHYVSPHRLRDAFAVNALKTDDSGEGQRFLQEQLGHTSFNTTARYRKVAGEELKDWYEKLWPKQEETNHGH